MENPIKMDDLGVPLFSETTLYSKQPRIVVVAHLNCENQVAIGPKSIVQGEAAEG